MEENDKQRTSELLQQIVDGCDGKTLTVQEFMELLGERTFALSAMIFGVLSAILPGVSIITAVPILLIGFQMVLGRGYIWLPKKVANAQISEAMLAKSLKKTIPIIKKIEIIFHPRMSFMFAPAGDRVMGLFFMMLAGILLLPVAGLNLIPGIIVTALALSILERDGLIAAVVMTVAGSSLFFVIEVVKLAITKMFT